MRSSKAFKTSIRVLTSALTVAAFTLSSATADQIDSAHTTKLLVALTDQVIVPGYEDLAGETTVLAQTLETYCAEPTAAHQIAAHASFHMVMDAWQRVQTVQFGPVAEAPGPARFQFWPDKRGTGQRQLRQLLNNQDESVLTPGALAEKSVALGDLQALEYVMFDNPEAFAVPGAFPCRYALAIAEHQDTQAKEIVDAWTGAESYRDQVVNAANGTNAFFDEKEAAGRFLNNMAATLDVVRLQKLDRPMGLTITGARPKRTESWRSARSLRNIKLNLETVKSFLTTKNGFGDLLASIGKEETARATQTLILDILSDIETFDQPLSVLMEDPDARGALESLLAKLRSLQSLVREQVAQDLGLIPGFNATDGD